MSDAGNNTGGQQQTPPAWYANLDAEHQGHVQTRGWDKLDPAQAAAEAAKAHVSATKMIGVPAEQLLRMPRDDKDIEGQRAMWQRLGAPADPTGYEFEVDVKDPGATASLVETLRNAAAGANLPKAAAAAVAKSIEGWVNSQTEQFNQIAVDNRAAAEEALKKSWGADYPIHSYTADQGKNAIAARLGERLAPQLDTALSLLTDNGLGEVGREIMRVIGAGLGEDSFKGGGGNQGGRVPPNRDQAMVRLAELQRDPVWVQKFLAGGAQERAEKKQLDVIIAGVSE